MSPSYKVGEIVWFNNSRNYFSHAFIHSSEVTRVTPGGKITLANGKEFKNGNEVKSKTCSYPCAYIISEQQAKAEIDQAAERKRKSNLVHDVLNLIATRKYSGNNYDLTESQEKALQTLLDSFNQE